MAEWSPQSQHPAGPPPGDLLRKLSGLEPSDERDPNPIMKLTDPNYASLPPYAISDHLGPRIEALGMRHNCAQIKEQGWTVLTGCFSSEHCDALAAMVRATAEGPEDAPRGGNMMLEKDARYSEMVLNEKMLALGEFMCGQGMQLSQVRAVYQ